MSERERLQELEEALRQRDTLIAELTRKLEKLTNELEAWKRGHRVRQGGKIPQKKNAAPEKNRPGQKAGHKGHGRNGPDRIDRFEDVLPPARCPHCSGEVALSDDVPGLQRVEEVVPGHVEVIGYRRHTGRCTRCGEKLRAALPAGLGHNPKVGLRAQATLVEAKTALGLTVGQLKKLMRSHYQLTLSPGGIQQILHRAAAVLKPALTEIKTALVASAEVWADETPLRIWGESGYLWLVMSREVVLFEADRSRGQDVPKRLLAGFSGVVHSDFYGAYFAVKWVTHAACGAHLTREARQLAERARYGTRPGRFLAALQAIYAEAASAQQKPETATAEAARLRAELQKLASDVELGHHPEVYRLQKRLRKRGEDLLRFVENPRLEGTNNRAERELRLLALMRHVSGGARSDEGARTLATLLSVYRTLQRQGGTVFGFFQAAREARHNGADFPRLTRPTPLLPA